MEQHKLLSCFSYFVETCRSNRLVFDFERPKSPDNADSTFEDHKTNPQINPDSFIQRKMAALDTHDLTKDAVDHNAVIADLFAISAGVSKKNIHDVTSNQENTRGKEKITFALYGIDDGKMVASVQPIHFDTDPPGQWSYVVTFPGRGGTHTIDKNKIGEIVDLVSGALAKKKNQYND